MEIAADGMINKQSLSFSSASQTDRGRQTGQIEGNRKSIDTLTSVLL